MLKIFAIAAPVLLGGVYVSGGFAPSEWSRNVGRPPADVIAALADLDVRHEPGAPGTDSSRSGGVPSVFRFSREGTTLRWTVMSGDKIATTMIAELQPIEDGRGTHLVAHVERGNASDDYVAPAFRSPTVTLQLFSMALEGEISELTAWPAKSEDECAKVFEEIAAANMANAPMREPKTLSGAVGQTVTNVVKLGQMEAEANRRGCHSRGFDNSPMQQEMHAADPGLDPATAGSGSPKPGEPMLDPTPPGDRRSR